LKQLTQAVKSNVMPIALATMLNGSAIIKENDNVGFTVEG
jgi:hypothetical protein